MGYTLMPATAHASGGFADRPFFPPDLSNFFEKKKNVVADKGFADFGFGWFSAGVGIGLKLVFVLVWWCGGRWWFFGWQMAGRMRGLVIGVGGVWCVDGGFLNMKKVVVSGSNDAAKYCA